MLYRATVNSAATANHGHHKLRSSPLAAGADGSEGAEAKGSSNRLRHPKRRIQRSTTIHNQEVVTRFATISIAIVLGILFLFTVNLIMLNNLSQVRDFGGGGGDASSLSSSSMPFASSSLRSSSSSSSYKRPLLPGSVWSTRKLPSQSNLDDSSESLPGRQGAARHNLDISHLISDNETSKALELCGKFYYSSLLTATKVRNPGTDVYVATGDIDMMWTRDSVVQYSIYLNKMKHEPWLRLLVEGEIRRNAFNIIQDPYANAYTSQWKDTALLSMKNQLIGRGGYVGTRNYELDSGAYFLNHIYDYYVSGIYKPETLLEQPIIYDAVNLLVDVWIIEQYHDTKSNYRYFELPNDGKGTPTAYTGMTWTGFRPSDDATQFGYLVPANIHAAAGLERLLVLNERIWQNEEFDLKVSKLLREIEDGINKYGIVNIPATDIENMGHRHTQTAQARPGVTIRNQKTNAQANQTTNDASDNTIDGRILNGQSQSSQQIYAYEVDGKGGVLQGYDDANVPSLLSIPLLGWTKFNVKAYQNTRALLLSNHNPYYYEGKFLKGIGSQHTRSKMVWPMSLIIQGLTENYNTMDNATATANNSNDNKHERMLSNMAFQLKQLLVSATKDSMHESVHADNPIAFSRYWFEWVSFSVLRYVFCCVVLIIAVLEDQPTSRARITLRYFQLPQPNHHV